MSDQLTTTAAVGDNKKKTLRFPDPSAGAGQGDEKNNAKQLPTTEEAIGGTSGGNGRGNNPNADEAARPNVGGGGNNSPRPARGNKNRPQQPRKPPNQNANDGRVGERQSPPNQGEGDRGQGQQQQGEAGRQSPATTGGRGGGRQGPQRQSVGRQFQQQRKPKQSPQQQRREGGGGDAQAGQSSREDRANQPPLEQQQFRPLNQIQTQRWGPQYGGFGGGGGMRWNRQQQQQRQQWQRGRRDGDVESMVGSKVKERADHAGVPMNGQISDCHICCQHSDLFGIGECMHPICMECTLRIRVVGESRQCPQCRAEIPMLYFVCAPPGQQLLLRLPTQNVPQPRHEREFGVRFESQYALDCFDAYMANRCQECAKRGNQRVEFGTFSELRAHMSGVHQLSFCHICCDNLNVLTKDRRVYTRDQLQQHMNGKLPGEEDGFRGHPTCQFCEERFYDDEQQYRHLRKEHYICQFCDQDGREQNVFYRNQHNLNQHNRRVHHPCLDPECLRMGICYRSELELDVHRAKHHHRLQGGSGTGGRGAPIPLEIQFSHSRGGIGGGSSRQRQQSLNEADENAASAGVDPSQQEQPRLPQSQVVRIVPSAQSQQQPVRIVRSSFANPLQSAAEFPGLPSAGPAEQSPYGAPPGWSAKQMQRQTLANQQQPAKAPRQLPLNSSEQFPSLGNGETSGSSTSTKVFGANQQNNTIWGQKSNKELFAPRPEGDTSKTKAGEASKRLKFVPTPDCWPEHMLEKLKAREQGLPDPDPIQLPNWLNPPKKEKKRKSKTVPVSAAANRLASAEGGLDLVPSSSKFNPLAAYDEQSEETSANGKTNWWTSGQPIRQQLKLTPSTDDPDFVRIQLPGDQRRSVQVRAQMGEPEKVKVGKNGKENQTAASLSMEPPPGFAALKQPANDGNEAVEDWEADEGQKEVEAVQEPPAADPVPQPPTTSTSFIGQLSLRSIASTLFGTGEGGSNVKSTGESHENAGGSEQ